MLSQTSDISAMAFDHKTWREASLRPPKTKLKGGKDFCASTHFIGCNSEQPAIIILEALLEDFRDLLQPQTMQTRFDEFAPSYVQDAFKEPDLIDLNTICRSFHKFTGTDSLNYYAPSIFKLIGVKGNSNTLLTTASCHASSTESW